MAFQTFAQTGLRELGLSCGGDFKPLCAWSTHGRARSISVERPEPERRPVHKVRVFNNHWHLPQSKHLRLGLGMILVGGGLLGFLPLLGF